MGGSRGQSQRVRPFPLRDPDRLALVYAGQRISYAELDDRIARTARLLAAGDIQTDDIVALFMKNSAAFFEIAFAASHLGAVFLPINFRRSREECEFIVGHAGAKPVCVDEEFSDVVAGLPHVLLLDDAAQNDTRTVVDPALPAVAISVRQKGDLMRPMYTSGTTDRPRGVMHSCDNFYRK
jgi:fatty-acyl-CoA synthase